jgi:tetratricopeptide (TPR) repeat protein
VKKIQKPRRSRETPPPAARQHFVHKIVSLVWSQHGRRLLLLWALALAAYSNSFHGGIFFDNTPALLQDPRIRAVTAPNIGAILTEGYWHITPNSGLYRPVTTLSYLLNYAVFDNGANPAGYHWFNFVLHGVNVSLVYALGILIFTAPSLALAFAAMWGLHPLLTESVTNIVGRADLLAAFGVLAGLLCYVQWASATGRRKHWWLAAMMAAQAIGLLSKENAAILPAILLLYDLTWSERASWRARAPAYAALLLPFAAFLYLRSHLRTGLVVALRKGLERRSGFWAPRANSLRIIGKSIRLLIWPDHLSADYSRSIPKFGWRLSTWQDGQVLVVLAVCLCAIALAVRWRRTWKAMFFFVIFFFVALAPTALAVPILAERFLYLPSIGLVGCVVAATYALGRRLSPSWPASPRVAWIAMGVVCLALAMRTYARNSDWHDELSLWSSAVQVVPWDARAHMSLGNALAQIPGRLPDAIAELQTGARMSPHDAREHYNLGRALAQMPDRAQDAVAEFQTALRLKGDVAAAVHYNLGDLLARMPGQLPDAVAEFQAALRIQPDFADAHNNLGNAFKRMPGRLTDAMAEWQAAVSSDPNLAEAHYNLGNAFSQMPGHLPDAIAEYQAALHGRPRFAQAHNNLANALAQTPGRLNDAIQEWRAALQLQPNLAQAHANLGSALAQIDQLPGAIAELEAAQRIHPDPQVQQMLDRLRKGRE